MTRFLWTLLSLSLSGTVLAGAVWLCRRLFGKRLSRAAQYYLWLLVLLRLVLPVGLPNSLMATAAAWVETALEARWSLQDGSGTPQTGDADALTPGAEGALDAAQVPGTAGTAGTGDGLEGTGETSAVLPGDVVALAPPEAAAGPAADDTHPSWQESLRAVLPGAVFALWAAGACFFFARDLIAYLRLRAGLKAESVPTDPEDLAVFRQMYGQLEGLCPVQLASSVAAQTPMLLGVLRPVLVLPARPYCKQGYGAELRLLLRHEMTHYRRRDLWYKWFLLAVRAVHWFNPVLPLLLRAIEQDCEKACDEAVTEGMSPALRRRYGSTLLTFAAADRLPAGAGATTLACNEKEVLRQRLQGILTPHRADLRSAALTLALALLLAGCGAALGAATQQAQAEEYEPPTAQSGLEGTASSGDAGDERTPEDADGQDAANGAALPSVTAPAPESDEVMVRVLDYVPNLYVELKYATADNLTGRQLYDFTEAWLRYGTVKKLAAAQQALNEQGYSLKIWDAYRPLSAQQALWEACPDPAYVSDPATGYLGHTRGNTLDVTLVTLDGQEVAMPSGFDQFDARADRDYSDVSAEAAVHAVMLQTALEDAGFVGYSAEWSHYYDRTEYDKLEGFEPGAAASGSAPAEAEAALAAYAALLAGDQSLLAEQNVQRWVPAFGQDGLDYEYMTLDLDGDGGEELLVQLAGDPGGYNGVFHYENGALSCWASDAAEMSCRDYPLADGTMVRQYDQGESTSFTLFRYTADGGSEETARLFARQGPQPGNADAPYPYYEINGQEVDEAAFRERFAALVTDRLLGSTAWNAL